MSYLFGDEKGEEVSEDDVLFLEMFDLDSLDPSKESRFVKSDSNVVDSMLEYQDPNPSIHDLFVVFNDKFFWGMLGGVEVKWSTRMTSCAGLCYYHGKRGLCSIRLSSPLLRFRSRKDLVETLLHEMIHAYLFVTRNYRDREDHGPEFCKHMHRINKMAGTNITIYHSFVNEVKYYQRHIWRCNGPCNLRGPYYGFVRRAMNRAPGPNDFWWTDHQMTCNGKFIKIAEPENTKKKKGAEKGNGGSSKQGTKDIRKYFPSPSSEKVGSSKKTSPNTKHGNNRNPSNVHTLKDLKSRQNGSPSKSNDKPSKSPNGASSSKDLKRDRSSSSSGHSGSSLHSSNVRAIKNPKSKSSSSEGHSSRSATKAPTTSPKDRKGTPSKGSKSSGTSPGGKRVQDTVREVWSAKYPSPPKRASTETTSDVEAKKREVKCPVCDQIVSESIYRSHLEECADAAVTEIVEIDDILECSDLVDEEICCPVCDKIMPKSDVYDHLESCADCSIDELKEWSGGEEGGNDVLSCPCCSKPIPEKWINSHIDECLSLIYINGTDGDSEDSQL